MKFFAHHLACHALNCVFFLFLVSKGCLVNWVIYWSFCWIFLSGHGCLVKGFPLRSVTAWHCSLLELFEFLGASVLLGKNPHCLFFNSPAICPIVIDDTCVWNASFFYIYSFRRASKGEDELDAWCDCPCNWGCLCCPWWKLGGPPLIANCTSCCSGWCPREVGVISPTKIIGVEVGVISYEAYWLRVLGTHLEHVWLTSNTTNCSNLIHCIHLVVIPCVDMIHSLCLQ